MVDLDLPVDGEQAWGPKTRAAFDALNAGKPDVDDVVLRGSVSVSVRDLGATGDGSTDDTAAFTAALGQLADGGTLQIPAGTYIISARLPVPSNVRIVGVPGRTALLAKAGSSASPLLMEMSGVSDVLIEGVTFDGNVTQVTNFNNVVVVYASTRVRFRSCHWRNTRGIGVIFSTNTSYSGVLDSTFYEVGTLQKTTGVATDRRQAIAFSSGTQASNVGNFVRGCTFNEVGLDCVSGSAQYGFLCSDNTIVNNYAGGFYLSNSTRVRVVANHAQGTSGGNGVDVYTCDQVTIVGNTMTRRGAAGIMVADTTNVTIAANVCTENWQSGSSVHSGGITVYGLNSVCSDVTIVGNRCTDAQSTKTQQFGVQVNNVAHVNVWVDDSNLLGGNAVAEVGGGGSYIPGAAYTATLTGVTVGNGSVAGVSRTTRTLVQAHGSFTLGSSSAINAAVYITLPATVSASIADHAPIGTFSVFDTSASAWRAGVAIKSGTQARLVLADGSNLSTSAPWTWASGDRIAWSLSYVPA